MTSVPMDQYLRCYIAPRESKAKETGNQHTRRRPEAEMTPGGLAIKAIGAPYAGPWLVLDAETTNDARQLLRFLVYELHGIGNEKQIHLYRAGRLTRDELDRLRDVGVAYNPEVCTPEEIESIRTWAAWNDYRCMAAGAFVEHFLYQWVCQYRVLCVGHNLPFDLSRLATQWGPADAEYSGGFWLKLCSCPHDVCFDHPAIRVKHLGRHKDLIAFRHVHIPPKDGSGKKRTSTYDGKFQNIATLARAILGPGDVTLAGLARRLALDTGKGETVHGEAITSAYLNYCRQDVTVTGKVYQALRDLYRRHGTRRRMWRIYSEASLSKAYLEDLDTPRFALDRPKVPNEVIGYAMQAYYGGRTEVNTRLAPTEVVACDFLSQYPTVNALMGLQKLLLAERIEIRSCTDEVRSFVASPDLIEQLQCPETWCRLRTLVKIRPQGDILPFRGKFGGVGVAATNIALSHINGPPTWYTLADVVAGVILSGGKIPEIEDAIELVPHGRVSTKVLKLFRDDRYIVDLTRHDFGTRLIDLRRETVAERDQATGEDEREYLDSLQRATKIVANSASYGVLLEVNADEPTVKPKPVTVYHHEEDHTRSTIVEKPGPYFAGAVGTFIPAAGRLLLAIAERLAADRGISYAHCDTDGITFARPVQMQQGEFHTLVEEITDWFTPLSPYEGGPPILQRENENSFGGKPETSPSIAVAWCDCTQSWPASWCRGEPSLRTQLARYSTGMLGSCEQLRCRRKARAIRYAVAGAEVRRSDCHGAQC